MAPKGNFRPPSARATLITFIGVISMVALLAAPVSAQSCYCTQGKVSYYGARCYYNGPYPRGQWVTLSYNSYYYIYCQSRGNRVGGTVWWNRVQYNNRYCYVPAYYMYYNCRYRCNNLGIC